MQKNKSGQYRQGDVLIERASPRKTKLQPISKGRLILAQGEATGHHHCLECDEADYWKDAEEFVIQVKAAAVVTHQEHAPIELPQGNYRVSRQREYSPEAIRNVAD